MTTLLWILASTFFVSLISFIGILTLLIKKEILQKILLFLVALAAGALMGGAFLNLIPEAVGKFASFTDGNYQEVLFYVLVGFSLFFIVEKVLGWRHCHKKECQVHTFTYTILLGDSVHNFIDGVIIAVSFVADISLGITATLAIALHEIPQEIGDFGVLVYGGFKETKALFLNFITALLAVIGGVVGYFISSLDQPIVAILLPLAAGGFIYIASSDLIPEIRKETDLKKSLMGFVVFLLGIFIIYAMKTVLHE